MPALVAALNDLAQENRIDLREQRTALRVSGFSTLDSDDDQRDEEAWGRCCKRHVR